MTNRASAARYARALMDVTRSEGGDLDGVERDLAAFVSLVDGEAALRRVLVNPALPAARKKALVAELLGRASLGPQVSKLLLLLAERDRLALLPDVLDHYRLRLLDLRNVVQAEVTTAVPLEAERIEALRAALAAMTGRQVAMTTRVDPGLIGGVVTRIGSTVYDGSVKRQLERMREALTQ
ncbi:MAG TPA: ATP synthase F1 subunit delta [Vicinamibacterales bacterium]|nr:ATP synthase F1 subunit delta [Vicinamibacterales bacterium]